MKRRSRGYYNPPRRIVYGIAGLLAAGAVTVGLIIGHKERNAGTLTLDILPTNSGTVGSPIVITAALNPASEGKLVEFFYSYNNNDVNIGSALTNSAGIATIDTQISSLTLEYFAAANNRTLFSNRITVTPV